MEFAYALLGAIYIGASVAFVEPNYAECMRLSIRELPI